MVLDLQNPRPNRDPVDAHNAASAGDWKDSALLSSSSLTALHRSASKSRLGTAGSGDKSSTRLQCSGQASLLRRSNSMPQRCGGALGGDARAQASRAGRAEQRPAKQPARPRAKMHMVWDKTLSHPSLRFSDDGRAVASDDAYHTVGGVHHTRVALGKDLLTNDMYQARLVYVGGSRAHLCAGVCQVDAPHLRDRRGALLNTWSLQGCRSTHRACWLYSFYHNKFSADGADWESLAKHSSKSTAEDGTIFDPGDALVIELSLPTGSLSFSRQAGSREGGTRIGRMSVSQGRFRFIALLGGMMGCVSFGPDAADSGQVLGSGDTDTLSLRRQMLAKRTCDLKHAHTF